MIPVSDRGEPDYKNIESLAREISAGWAARFNSKNADMFYDKIKTALQPQVKEYVEWIIEEERKVRQAFWDEFNKQLDRKLKEAEELEKKAVAAREQLRRSARDLVKIEAKPVDARSGGVMSQVEITITKILEEVSKTFGKIGEGVSKLPGQMHKAISNSEIMKGLEFGFRAAGVVMEKTGQIVLYDVVFALLSSGMHAAAKWAAKLPKAGSMIHRAFNFISSPPTNIDILSGRLLTATQIYKNYSSLKESAEIINSQIVKIKNEIFLDTQDDVRSN